MLRSLIAHVFFLFAITATLLAGQQSARAEMPFEAWLSVAADSIDQQIEQQKESSWQSLRSMGQITADSFDDVMDQCRMGVGGKRGLQLVQAIDLFVELRDSGVAGVVASEKNYELPRCGLVQGDARSNQSRELKATMAPVAETVEENFSTLLSRGSAGLSLLADLVAQAKETIARLEEEAYRPVEPLVRAAHRAWDRLTSFADQDLAEVSDSSEETEESSTLSDASNTLEASVFAGYLQEVSHSAEAKLHWLTSKVRHIAEACLKSIEPQFLILEFDFVNDGLPADEAQEEVPSHPSVAELPHFTH